MNCCARPGYQRWCAAEGGVCIKGRGLYTLVYKAYFESAISSVAGGAFYLEKKFAASKTALSTKPNPAIISPNRV